MEYKDNMLEDMASKALAKAKQVDGFLSDAEGIFLYKSVYKLASANSQINVVEIGSYMGRSTVLMAMAIRDSQNPQATIYAVDPFLGSSEHADRDTFESFSSNIARHGVEGYVSIIRKDSEAAADEWEIGDRVDFLWIDGAHEYEYVVHDFALWYRYLKPGSIIAVHDAGGFRGTGQFVGVRKAVREFMFGQLVLKDYNQIDSILSATKTHHLTNDDLFNNWKAKIMWEYNIPSLSIVNQIRLINKLYKYIPRKLRKPSLWFGE